MHRTKTRPRALFSALLLALIVGGLPAVGRAQPVGPANKAIIVPVNGTVRFQMTTKKPIKRVVNPRDTVVTVRNVVGDPTTVLLTGQTADTTTIELTDEADVTERYEVIVQRDIENLRTQLRRAVPTANLMPTPIGDVDVIIGGTVQRADDIEVIVRVAA